jgi:hypothetical protein
VKLMSGAFDRVGWFVINIAVITEPVLSGDEIVLAAPPDVIAVVFENLEQTGVFTPKHVEHRAMAAHMRIPAGHETAATGRANGALAKSGSKADEIVADGAIQVRGNGCTIPHVTQNVPTPLIGIEDHHIGSLFHKSDS